MSMLAKIMATLGLDGSKFHAGIDKAEKETKRFQLSLRTLTKVAAAAFGVGMFTKLIGAFKELRSYQDRSGISLISDYDLNQIDAASDSIEKLKMQMIAFTAEGVSKFLQGIKAAAAAAGAYFGGARGEEINQAMAGAITPEAKSDAISAKDKAAYDEKRRRLDLEAARELMTKQEKLASLEKETAEAKEQYVKAAKAGTFEAGQEIAALERIDELERKVAKEKKSIADDAAKQAAKESEDRYKESNERLQKEQDELEKAAKKKEELAKKEADIRAKFADREKEIRSGKDQTLSALNPALNSLASIGGYIGNTKAAAGIVQRDRTLELNERIAENTAAMKAALESIASDGGE